MRRELRVHRLRYSIAYSPSLILRRDAFGSSSNSHAIVSGPGGFEPRTPTHDGQTAVYLPTSERTRSDEERESRLHLLDIWGVVPRPPEELRLLEVGDRGRILNVRPAKRSIRHLGDCLWHNLSRRVSAPLYGLVDRVGAEAAYRDASEPTASTLRARGRCLYESASANPGREPRDL